MTLELWAAFVAASSILLVIPSPTVLLVVSYALGQGWRTALPMAVGVALGDFTAMTLYGGGHLEAAFGGSCASPDRTARHHDGELPRRVIRSGRGRNGAPFGHWCLPTER